MEMSLEKSAAAYGTDEFKDVFCEEFADNLDPADFESDADIGGDASDIEVSVLSATDEESEIVVMAMVSYVESRRSGCRDITLESNHTVRYTVTIDMKSGDSEVEETDHRSSWGQ